MMEVDHSPHEASGTLPPDASFPGKPVAVTLREAGKARPIEAMEGESLMVALRRAGLPLLAICGGTGACGTCKVGFPPDWGAKLTEPGKRELLLLTHLKVADGERLSCRIVLTTELNGLEVDACTP